MCHILLNNETPEAQQLFMSKTNIYSFHQNFSSVVTCSHKHGCLKTKNCKSLKSKDHSAVSSAGVASVNALKAVFLPIPLICPHVSHPVKQWNPGSSAAFDVPRRTHIGFIKIFLLLSPVAISMVVWRPSTVSLWRARTITSVSWVMICTLLPALGISVVCSVIRVSASSCVLTTVDGWISFMLLFTCRRVTVSTWTFSCKT